ncbi:hypothetical protein DMENIID0001_153320 [Sergentomyia squamirostris]
MAENTEKPQEPAKLPTKNQLVEIRIPTLTAYALAYLGRTDTSKLVEQNVPGPLGDYLISIEEYGTSQSWYTLDEGQLDAWIHMCASLSRYYTMRVFPDKIGITNKPMVMTTVGTLESYRTVQFVTTESLQMDVYIRFLHDDCQSGIDHNVSDIVAVPHLPFAIERARYIDGYIRLFPTTTFKVEIDFDSLREVSTR